MGKAASVPGPGLKLQITKVEIPADKKPVVTFQITDDKGGQLRPADLDANSIRFALARLVMDEGSGLTHYESFLTREVKGTEFTFKGEKKQPAAATATQAALDQGGKVTEVDGGYTYVFSNTLTAEVAPTATLVAGGQASRNSRASVANAIFPFVPAGGTPISREVVKTDNCNRCHDPLVAHGARIETQYCVLCHSPQSTDPQSGNTVDFKVMVHKIHAGETLPSVEAGTPYFIGGDTHNFSDVAFPQDLRNCTTCHDGAKDGDNWKTAPSAAACGSCHDDVNFQTGENHPGGPQPNDAACKMCHKPDGQEFDISVSGAHTLPNASKQFRGVKFELVSASDTQPGQSPTVVFNVKDNAGKAITPAEMASLSFTLAGPTSDYANRWTESAMTRTVEAGGNLQYTFSAAIPADAKGTFAIGVEGFITATLTKADGSTLLGADKTSPLVVRDAGYNQVVYVPVTDAKAAARRVVVLRDNCNRCHQDLGNPAGLSVHGGLRRNTEYCVLCHNPNATDEARRPAYKMPPETISFDVLIHRLHTGKNLGEPYVIYGFGNTAVDFSGVAYPGKRNDCAKCHDKASYTLPLAKAVLPVTVSRTGATVSTTLPATAACTACHNSAAAKGHADFDDNRHGRGDLRGLPRRSARLRCGEGASVAGTGVPVPDRRSAHRCEARRRTPTYSPVGNDVFKPGTGVELDGLLQTHRLASGIPGCAMARAVRIQRLSTGDRVAVIGGGPARSFAALNLLRFAEQLGIPISVTIFERKDFGRRGAAGCNGWLAALFDRLRGNSES